MVDMRRLCPAIAVVAVCVACVGAPKGARAATLEISGAGYGHGVGMSQYGAYGFARRGHDYRFILRHYYTGTALGRVDPARTVRVLLSGNLAAATFSGASRAGGRSLDPRRAYQVRRRGLTRLELRTAAGRSLGTFSGPLRATGGQPLRLAGRALNGLRDGRYRGALEFRPAFFGGVNAINAVALDDYVRGVVAGEMPPSWSPAALQAQSVAARTYAITTSKGGDGWDQYADTRSQVYGGISAETPNTDRAVAETSGHVVTYRGAPVVTYFFSTSGGRTEDVENVWAGAARSPWLRSVEDPYDSASPRHRWTPVRMTLGRAQKQLG